MNCRVKYPTSNVLPAPVKPFESIIVKKNDATNEITVTAKIGLIMKDEFPEGATFGLAIDGSRSMMDLYGISISPFPSPLPNLVEPVAKTLLNKLVECSDSVDFAYWAVGPGGKEVEDVGCVTLDRIDSLKIRPKKSLGSGTYLMPIIKHFVEDKLKDAPWAMAIIITDGKIDDMEDVMNWTEQYAVAINAGKQKLIKLVLIGLGEEDEVYQLERLENFVTSVGIDVWSSNLAVDLNDLNDKIFDEVLGEVVIAPSGKIIDDTGKVLKAYNDNLPARMEFKLKPGSTKFKLEIQGKPSVEQDLSEALALLK